MKYKGIIKAATKTVKRAGRVAVPLAYAAKGAKFYTSHKKGVKQGIKIAKKVATVAAKNAKHIGKASSVISKHLSSGSFNVPGAVVDATLGIAKRQTEKYLDKKLGKYKAYRMIKAGVDTAYDLGTGQYVGALKNATKLYAEADPNKKRAAKIKGAINGVAGFGKGIMKGDVLGAYEGLGQVYSVADPNKQRVAKFNNINSNYIAPTIELNKQTNLANKQAQKSSRIFNRK